MASYIIHIAIAQEVNKELKKDKSKILIGSIAPDISKLVGESKKNSHFQDSEVNFIPNLEKFLNKYKKYLNDDFVLGYYIHLYTDYLWFKYFIPEIFKDNKLKKLDGTIIEVNKETKLKYLYEDYSKLNKKIIEKYNIDLDIFINKIPDIDKIIEEIPLDKLNILIDKTISIIDEEENKEPTQILNIKSIEEFINNSSKKIISNLKQILT